MAQRIYPTIIILVFSLCFNCGLKAQTQALTIQLSVATHQVDDFKPDGRLLIFLSQRPGFEPRLATWPMPGNYLFAKNFTGLNPEQSLTIQQTEDWMAMPDWELSAIPAGTYYLQIVWDQDTQESRIDAPGNLHSTVYKVDLTKDQTLEASLSEQIPERTIVEHELVRLVEMQSDTLTKWWGKPMHLKATLLLPPAYDKNQFYPIRYNVAGYGGRYDRINRLVANKDFMEWWQSDDAPQLINVFLDGEGPFGDSYQMDSENSGPYGYALINELIPYIEQQYRKSMDAETRFVDGCSTGGWVSLGLQLYYPETFNGVFSYSPDPVEFENYQLINIYKEKNAYVNEYGFPRPVAREISGEPMLSLKDFVQYENVLGASDTYLNSGGQFSAHTALYSPKGENGLPKPLIDPQSGKINPDVAAVWKKYDFKIHAKENWATLGPKLQGKIYIWMGDMDHFYLNPATRAFDEFLQKTENPKSDAVVEYTAMAGHCQLFSNRRVLEQMQERLLEIGE